MSIRIVLADDHKILRDGLRSLLAGLPEMRLVGEAADGRDALRLANELSPDVVIMDVAMPGLNGIEATRQIHLRSPDIKIIALSMHTDARFVAGMLTAGATAFLRKDCAFEELAQALHAVIAGQVFLSSGITGVVVQDYVRRGTVGLPGQSPLSQREREVLQLIAEGQSTKAIATNLKVSVKTIETHRQNLMARLGIRSVAELTKYAVREGLTSLE